MSFSKPLLVVALLLVLSLNAFAADYVVVNSQDGRDVLSGVFYANAKGLPVRFMTYSTDPDFLAGIVGANHSVLLIQSDLPISSAVEQAIAKKGNTVELFSSAGGKRANLDLAVRSGANSFIIVDSAYSDSALSVLSYAYYSKSFVIMADKDNIDEVKAIVKGKKVMIYGLVDKDVKAALSSENPEIIGTGQDKYEDNILIVKKTMDDYSLSTIIIADGSFLEDSISAGSQPVLLTGNKLVPQPTYDFIKSSTRDDKLKSVMLLGNSLVMPIYDMRKRVVSDLESEGLNKTFGLIVKFAQAVPSSGSGVMNLNTFPLPLYKANVEISEIVYNGPAKKVMSSVSNIGDGAAYYTMEIKIKVNGADYKVFPVDSPRLIERGESLGSQFDADLSSIPEGNISAFVLVKFGTSGSSLDSFISKEGALASINYSDQSNVTVQAARYDQEKKRLLITLKNNGDQDAFAFTRVGLILGGVPVKISGSGTREIAIGSMVVEEIPLELTDADFERNKNINVSIDYGARQGFLLKKGEYVMPLEKEAGFPLWMLAGLLLLLLLILLGIFLYRRNRKDDKPEKKSKK